MALAFWIACFHVAWVREIEIVWNTYTSSCMDWTLKIHSIYYGCVRAQNNDREKKVSTGGKEVCYNKGHAGIKRQRKVWISAESVM